LSSNRTIVIYAGHASLAILQGAYLEFESDVSVEVSVMGSRLEGELETILVVDDNEDIRHLILTILEQAHFRVFSADSGAAAMEVSKGLDERIDLLLSDVEMPNMSGPDLGEAMKKTRPDMHVMLMSGGPDGNLLVLNYGWAYIQKPFVAVKLIEMIGDVLHTPDRSQPGGHAFDTRKDIDHKG
jgi:DNA-binding NtrC family response regulator